MPPYRNPGPDVQDIVKFIRLEEDIFVGERIDIGHKRIAEIDRLEERIRQLKNTNPTQIDAGYIRVTAKEIKIFDHSPTLELPIPKYAETARAISQEIFAAQTPNREIKI